MQERADEDRVRARLDDPVVQQRIREIKDEMRRPGTEDPGIDAERLPDFLRERGQ